MFYTPLSNSFVFFLTIFQFILPLILPYLWPFFSLHSIDYVIVLCKEIWNSLFFWFLDFQKKCIF
jgi:hypothetical protein